MSWTHLGTYCHVAGREHSCSTCPCWIVPGMQYIKQVGIYNGEFQASNHCPNCIEFMDCSGDFQDMLDLNGGEYEFDDVWQLVLDLGQAWWDNKEILS